MAHQDIRDLAWLPGEAVRRLNFIRDSKTLVFRKFYRAGLRSHIFEVLLKKDVARETQGIMKDGIRLFPRARPLKMFRIFRRRFSSMTEIFHEIQRYRMLLDHIGADHIARSEEFIADYRGENVSGILLCGLQEYVHGEILDPWRALGPAHIHALLANLTPQPGKATSTAVTRIHAFTRGVREMISQKGYIPDLAGLGNLILTPEGGIKLVDINNIVAVNPSNDIPLDDKAYPACDVSVQVLFLLERNLLGLSENKEDPLFQVFMAPERLSRVRRIEQAFSAV